MPLPQAIHRTQAWYRRLTVPQFTVVTGLLVISLGTLLLASPLCSSQNVGLWEALFTATSAVTVTGLTVIDVGRDLTTCGQAVLALMILVGGLGLMAITTFLQGFVVRGASLRRRLDRGQTLDEFGVGGVGGTFRSIALTAAALIIVGAAVLYNFGFSDIPAGGERLWASVFHSISAYNNAGFGLWSDSLVSYRTNRVVNAVIMILIVLGGLGWRVTSDLWSNRQRLKRKNLSLHTRLVLRTSILLVLTGTLGLLLTESLSKGHVMTTMGWGERMMSALFESVSARTAGFTTLPLSVESVSDSGLLLLMTLMFIGASPGGTGGGIKTTTVAALMAATRSTLRGQDNVVIRHRQISDKVVLRALSITMASLMFVLVMAMLLALSTNQNIEEPLTFLELLFTCISAFATVGLDLGVTEQLGRFGQLILVVGMFVGRLGILLLLSAIWESFDRNQLQRQNRIGYPREDLYV
ncbi:TrkH family potassium uptake protein [Synechococcus sp. NOUM97013]|uniref:TrkH family potassium uptake protein n=1 Tax=Synechococcus sp. NOUM97013 TaxID=1442555 RepID=UPI001646088F|nr:potassium transporter TrkG [Synechococcus sp. NOUM97013]QNI74589.1 Ktr-type potassium uptake transporter/ potassium-translocating subunit B [Synechococcus sp. NOUM97013]